MTPRPITSAGGPGIGSGAQLRWERRRVFLVGLTAAAGWLDALAFIYLGNVFISFMSGNLLFLGIGAGEGDGGLVVRAGAVLAAFLVGTVVGGRITGSRLVPGAQRPMGRTLLVEASLLAAFAVLWLAGGSPAGDATLTLALLVVGSAAMGLQAAIALAFHLPNVATVAMTATLAQLGALVGWRGREGDAVVARTPAVSLMIPLCLAYLISAVIVASVPATPAMALGPVLLLGSTVAIESLHRAPDVPRGLAAERARG